MSVMGAPSIAPVRMAVVARAGGYMRLTKPRIIELLLITTVPAMVLAHDGVPPAGLVAVTLAGGALAAGGANALNMFLDREIDAVMDRTASRPIPAGVVRPVEAALLGVVLLVGGTVLLAVAVNPLAAGLTFGAGLFYVGVYTAWLKRRSPQNIVIGGAAGAVPPLAGWAAVEASIGIEALLLAAIVFLWTPPHFWALALHYRDDYATAGVPMLPVVRDTRHTLHPAVAYAGATWAASIVLWAASPLGTVYVVAAVGLGGWFVAETVALARRGGARPMRVFGVSIVYLGLLFGAVALDPLL